MRTFYPRNTVIIDADAPHPDGTQYKVSVGDEDWGDGTYQKVIKVQMMYDGKVAGRMSPSYPVKSSDWKKVAEAIEQITEYTGNINEKATNIQKNKDTYMVPTVISKDGLLLKLDEIISLTEDRPSSYKMRYLDSHSGFISYKMTNIFEYMFEDLKDKLKLLCEFNKIVGLETCDEYIKCLQELDTDDDFFPYNLIESVEDIKKSASGEE